MPRRPPRLLLASTAPLPAAPIVAVPDTERSPSPSARGRARARAGDGGRARGSTTSPTPGRLYAGLAVLTLALAALSLLAPSTPSYDPWSWDVWAREIIHGHLTITDTGTSWKPLPMILTIPFALLGGAAADLWLMVARAGAIAAVLMAFRLAYRLTRELALARHPDATGNERRVAVQAPAILAGLLALIALGFAARGGYITANGLGYSEGLATALLLVAIECHLDGRDRASFLIGFLVALDRPEIWLFWVPYGLWLGWRDRRMRPVIALAFLLQPVAWFLPVYLGSGHVGSSVARAENPRANSLAYASNPFLDELTDAAWPSMMLRAKLMAMLVVLGAGGLGWRTRAGSRGGGFGFGRFAFGGGGGGGSSGGFGAGARARTPAARAVLTAALLGLGGLAWFVVVALMTQLHFSGNDRYLVLGAALVDICAAVGFGCLAIELGRACAALGASPGRGRRAGLALGTGLAAAVFAMLPGWIESQDFVALPKVHGALLYQAHLRESLSRAIARVGGRRRALACGRVMTEGFQVPMVAYALDVATPRVLAPPAPGAAGGPAPNLILQTQATRSSTLLPIVRTWPHVQYTYRGTVGPWRTFTHCASGS